MNGDEALLPKIGRDNKQLMTRPAAEALFEPYKRGSRLLLMPTLDLGIVDRFFVLAGDTADGCYVFWNQLYPQESFYATHVAHLIQMRQLIDEPLFFADDNENEFWAEELNPEDQLVCRA